MFAICRTTSIWISKDEEDTTFRVVTTICFILGLSVTRVVYGEKCGGIISYLLARFIASREFLRNATILLGNLWVFYESMSRQVAKLTRAIWVFIQFNMSGYTVCFPIHDKLLCILTSGVGSRLEDYSKDCNKALLSINKETILTKILKNFTMIQWNKNLWCHKLNQDF